MTAMDRRTFNRALLAGAAGVAVPAAARPRGAVAARWTLPAAELPESPVGEQLRWVIAQANGAAADLTERALKRRFSTTYLEALPAKDLLGVFRDYLAPSGPMALSRFEGPTDGTMVRAILTTPGPDWRVTIGVDPADPSTIDEFFVEPVRLPAAPAKPPRSWDDLGKALAKVAPRVSFMAAEVADGEPRPIHALTKDRTLGIGSSFKLYVLGELTRQIEAGEAVWDEPLAIHGDLRSLPNGDMRLEPDGATFPLRRYAEQMIAASDNTATDHLIVRLGRERVESAFAAFGHARPERNVPLLLTREWFAFKLRIPLADVDAYLAAGIDEKRAMLADEVEPAAATLTDVDDWVGSYLVEEIEWFASAADLCRVVTALLERSTTAGLGPVATTLSMNPGIPFDARTWAYVGYKGGYETGVKSDVWLLQRGDGRWFVTAAIINDPRREIDGIGLWTLMVPVSELLAGIA